VSEPPIPGAFRCTSPLAITGVTERRPRRRTAKPLVLRRVSLLLITPRSAALESSLSARPCAGPSERHGGLTGSRAAFYLRPVKQTIVAPNGLRWTVKRLIVPTGMRPMSRTEMLDAATPRRTRVEGMSRQVPDATNAPTGPIPLGFLLLPLALPFVPLALLLRRVRVLPWTIEARTYPSGRRYPPLVLTYTVRGGDETRRAFSQLVAALARGDGAPVIDGAERLAQPTKPHSGGALVGTTGPQHFDK
jgi:hypothetical protein